MPAEPMMYSVILHGVHCNIICERQKTIVDLMEKLYKLDKKAVILSRFPITKYEESRLKNLAFPSCSEE